MEGTGGMISNLPVWGYVLLVIITLVFIYWGYRIFKGNKDDISKSKSQDRPVDFPDVVDSQVEEKEGLGLPLKLLGTGTIKCVCFRKIKGVSVADFTNIPEPIGEMYNFDPSCPLSGSGYIVKEENGRIVDYDPREVEYKLEESPEYAWFASQWEIVKTVFFVPLQWWRSSSFWFAAAMLVIVFITSLAALGG